MSCYICSKETLETVLKAWMLCKNMKIKTQDDIYEAWMEIERANYQAYADRYGRKYDPEHDHSVPPLTIEEWFFTSPEHKPNRAERYSALKEYMYQCAEGDYHNQPGYYKSQWCLDDMLKEYVSEEFPDFVGWGLYK